MTAASRAAPGRPPSVRLEIRRVTLHGYHPGQRDHFAGIIQAQIAARGAPADAARAAAEAILTAADAEMGRSYG
jgi:hypothetical protein